MIKKRLKDYIIIIFATFILAVAFNTTFLPLEIIVSGSSGLSIIANHFFYISPSLVVMLSYFIAVSLGYFILGKEKIAKSIFGSIMYPIWIYITSPLTDYTLSLSLNNNEYLVLIIIGAVISGAAFGLIYKTGYTTSGSDILSQIINKYLGTTLGTGNLIINSSVVIAGGMIFGWTKVLYAILTLYIMGIAADKVLLGISYSKSFYIITEKVDAVKQYIHNEFNQSITELEAIGGYTNDGSSVLMCVVPNRYYFKLREGINIIDEGAFFVIMDAYELKNRRRK